MSVSHQIYIGKPLLLHIFNISLFPSYYQSRLILCACVLVKDDWIVAQTFMGITTSYKHDADGSLWVKLHGTMEEVRVMDQLATIREVDLFKTWVPFCDKSTLLKRLGIVELLVYFNTSMPGVSR